MLTGNTFSKFSSMAENDHRNRSGYISKDSKFVAQMDEPNHGDLINKHFACIKTLTLRDAAELTLIPYRTLHRACVNPESPMPLDYFRFTLKGKIRILLTDLTDYIDRLKEAW